MAAKGDIGIHGKRSSPRVYGPEAQEALKGIWKCLDYLCWKRLAAAMAGAVEALERHRETALSPEVREKLLSMSGGTIDRILAVEMLNALYDKIRLRTNFFLPSMKLIE